MGAREEETVSDHDHHHAGDLPGPHGSPLTETQLRVKALESLLVDKGLVDPAALVTRDAMIGVAKVQAQHGDAGR